MTTTSKSPNSAGVQGQRRRPRRSGDTADAISRAGRRLFARHAVDSIAIDQIVAEAAVSKGSFYNHFKDKEQLVEAIVGETRDTIEAAVAAANADQPDPARRVARALCVFYRYAVDEPERAIVLVRVHGSRLALDMAINQGLVDDVTRGLGSGRFEVATVEAGLLFVHGIAQVGILRIAQQPLPALAVTLAQQLCALVLRGLGVDAAAATVIAAQSADELVRAAGKSQ